MSPDLQYSTLISKEWDIGGGKLLDAAIDWNGAKGAAFAVLGSSSLAVIGFYVAILNLQQIHIRIDPPADGGAPQPDAATTTPATQRD